MKFSEKNVNKSLGLILAHSISKDNVKIKKGTILEKLHIKKLFEIGVKKIFTVKLDKDDIFENEAAKEIGKVFFSKENVRVGKSFSGRVNIFSTSLGIFNVNEKVINKSNSVNYSLTIATLSNNSVVSPGQIIATIKVIPYGVKKSVLNKFLKILNQNTLTIFDVKLRNVSLIVTQRENNSNYLNDKIIDSVNHRLFKLGIRLNEIHFCKHDKNALANLLEKISFDLVLILLATATTDINDIGPSAIKLIKGKIIRFGMPVDPGNLLFLGQTRNEKMVIGLPGCIKSKSLNGADWIIERLVCGMTINNEMISSMGVGGLLKEISNRPRPRIIESFSKIKKIDIMLLAAGKSTRMQKEDKLLLKKNNKSLLQTSVEECTKANLNKVHVILGYNKDSRKKILKNFDVNVCFFEGYEEGIGASIRYGMQFIKPEVDAVIISLADMPKVKHDLYLRLIEKFNKNKNNEICRLFSSSEKAGHPILFSKRFFENLRSLTGDTGAKELIKDSQEYLCKIYCDDDSPIYDIDNIKDYDDWTRN